MVELWYIRISVFLSWGIRARVRADFATAAAVATAMAPAALGTTNGGMAI